MIDNHTSSEDQRGIDRSMSRRRLTIALILVLVYATAEVIGGLVTNSLALLADAGHMISDAAALGLSLFALWLATRPAAAQRTFGHCRAEVLAALVNGVTLVIIAIVVFVEAFQRFRRPPDVMGGTVLVIAFGGLVINLAGLTILHGARHESLNVKGAWLHVLGDTLGSVGAIAGGFAIWRFQWYWADPVASVIIGLLILLTALQLIRESAAVLLEHAPDHINVADVRRMMLRVDGVQEVHDLHVWTVTSGLESLSAHVRVTHEPPAVDILRGLRTQLRKRFGIDHITLQLEPVDFEEHHLCSI